MKILQLISSGGMYGAENVVLALARELREMGHSSYVAIFENAHCPRNEVAEEFEAQGIKVIRIPCRGRWDRKTVHSIRSAIKANEIELIHSHGYKADVYGYFAARRLNIPLVATCHLWTGHNLLVRAYDYIDIRILRRFDAVVAVSDAIAEQGRRSGIDPGKIAVIDNGIDISRYQPRASSPRKTVPTEQLTIGTVGRLVPQKGITYFLQAAAEILKEFPEARFSIVGDGPDRQPLEQYARQLGICDSVLFLGSRSDMPEVYASMDIFVLASTNEGLPMVLLEALASGKAVVATDVGAVSKVIIPGQTGLLVAPADARGLSQAVLSLVRNPALRHDLATSGASLVSDHFSCGAMARKYKGVYEHLVETNPNNAPAVCLTNPGMK